MGARALQTGPDLPGRMGRHVDRALLQRPIEGMAVGGPVAGFIHQLGRRRTQRLGRQNGRLRRNAQTRDLERC